MAFKPVQIRQKSGIVTNSGFCFILDEFNTPFYFHPKKKYQKFLCFNLPKGNYFFADTLIYDIKKPYIYTTPDLPKPDRNDIANPNVSVSINKDFLDKARIYIKEHRMNISNSINASSSLINCFVRAHEIGHYRYSDEWKCDVFSAYVMLGCGYNPSQILIAQRCTIRNSEGNKIRFKEVTNFLSKCKI